VIEAYLGVEEDVLEVKDLWVALRQIEAVKGVSLHVDEAAPSPSSGRTGRERPRSEDHLGFEESDGRGNPVSRTAKSRGKMRRHFVKLGIAHCPEGEGYFLS